MGDDVFIACCAAVTCCAADTTSRAASVYLVIADAAIATERTACHRIRSLVRDAVVYYEATLAADTWRAIGDTTHATQDATSDYMPNADYPWSNP